MRKCGDPSFKLNLNLRMPINNKHPRKTSAKLNDRIPRKDSTETLPPDILTSFKTEKHPIPLNALDPDAIRIVHRLNNHGYKAYLVGGCIRDILLGTQPKDFDLVTSAQPQEIRRLFRNCRLIGRRFRLAHLLFKDGKIIEVATFRRTPTDQDKLTGRHAAENLFGDPADDAIRRDFTINALMYDVEKREILDWVSGLKDIDTRLLRTIGDPDRRLPEDPVRIIRAIKFGVRLNLKFDPPLWQGIKRHASLIKTCSQARLVEEVFKLLRSGSSERCLDILHERGVLQQLMPNLASFANSQSKNDSAWSSLTRADQMIKSGRFVSDSVLLSAMLYTPCYEILKTEGDADQNLEEILKALLRPLIFTRKHITNVRQIILAQHHLMAGPKTKRSKKILDRDYSREAIDFFEINADNENSLTIAAQWRKLLPAHNNSSGQFLDRAHPKRRRRPRRIRNQSTTPPISPKKTN